ncbi:hypothetical protein FDP41_000189 [Naegleria fowleri]|uniref:Uncharacterized protein n=1 Tax=Naegleria fowleri TaxID=5763 RepID=A0A6A5CI33_NAEFO|nr:uncharacterized protein FDP41_000189 [Naegleria fowleri]KAF0985150.1 hypothetical protein FDP41_000189 [Naegleria fowleri]CAG4708802.1 unnamed protein product [Naegleria fowleri]
MFDRVGDHILTKREKSVLNDCFWTAGIRALIGGVSAGGLLAFIVKKYQKPQKPFAKIAVVSLFFIGGVYLGSASAVPYCLRNFAKLEDSELGDTARRFIMAVTDQTKQEEQAKSKKQEYDWEEEEKEALKKELAQKNK